MKCNPVFFLLALLLSLNGKTSYASNDVPAVVYLDKLAAIQGWRQSDLKIQSQDILRIADRPALQLHVSLESSDRNTSWPKAWCPVVNEASTDWTKFDRLEFWAMARLRPPLVTPPKRLAVQFLCPDKDSSISSTILFPESDTWVRVSIPTRDHDLFKRLNAMQFYLAKRWYVGVDTVDFYVGGFRLVRDPGPLADEYHLLTPFPGSAQPVLRLEADAKDTFQMHLERNGRLLHEVSAKRMPSGQFSVDLSSLALPQGRYELVANRGMNSKRRVMPFDWHPFEVKEISIGEGFVGENIATVHIRNASQAQGLANADIKLNGEVLVRKKIEVAANATAEVKIHWPLKPGSKGKAVIQMHVGNSYIDGMAQMVDAPDVYANINEFRPVTFEHGRSITFRMPVSLASGSRQAARLDWKLSDQSGHVIEAGRSEFIGSSAEIRVNASEKIRPGHYILRSTIKVGKDEFPKEMSIYFLQDPIDSM